MYHISPNKNSLPKSSAPSQKKTKKNFNHDNLMIISWEKKKNPIFEDFNEYFH